MSSAPEVDIAVVGGGVVGLSVAYEAARAGRSVVVLERLDRLGQEQSTHNSMVLHAGLYYPPGSLKARLCVEGRAEMVRRLSAWNVPYRITRKLVVAAGEDEVPRLEALLANADEAGAAPCRLIPGSEIPTIEPATRGVAALWSSGTGILDAGGYVAALAARCEASGTLVLTSAEVVGLSPSGASIEVATSERGTVRARVVVNAAGLRADRVARMAGNNAYKVYPCRGEYAAVVPRKADLVRGLVYPLPGEDVRSLGVHLTRTVFGDLWIGPTARYVDSPDDYESDRLPLSAFATRAARLADGLDERDLRLGPSGIRAKRVPDGAPAGDFLIEADPSVPGLIHLIGIESPGLTASPAIGREVARRAGEFL